MLKLTVKDIRAHAPALIAAFLIIAAAFLIPRLLNSEDDTPPPVVEDLNTQHFRHDCIDGILQRNEILPACASLQAIYTTYHVDAATMLIAAQGRLIMTARRVARGDITDEKSFKHCLKKGECVPIPLPNANTGPAGASHAEFWHLVNDGGITEENCNLLDICRALVKSGIMKSPPALPAQP